MKLHFAPALRVAAIVAGTVLSSQSAFAGLVASIEAAGVQQSTASNIITETFNDAALGKFSTLTSDIGTYTASINSSIILAADQYGGADGSRYVSVGSQAGGNGGTMTLSLNGPADYFGMWWSAVDRENHIAFYSGGVVDNAHLVASFSQADILALITASGNASAYYGNPNDGYQNSGEPYAYVNFTGATFDTIVFSNSNATGFESDNHSIHGVPEPSALLMGGAASVIGLAVARRRRRDA
ncbi:MAG: hypothetical protein P4L85_11160 [Paludisphaera borealis]|uniref:Npun_F0296 family exosortase-dependent surface protein n=1 Tax=Paludisphaera borealis TaxID=1387353 RepID=UPI002841FEA4|nr:hypothetical protein [Paludisphaera borealis]MDR3619898.1 hypothetical protein [Paludisphaera borealis]